MKLHEILLIGVILAAAGITSSAAARQHAEEKGRHAMFEIPTALKVEHEKLHVDLSAATKLPGKTGQAAKAVAKVLHEHFLSEEEFAMPPLALLVPIAEGRVTPEMRSVITLTDRLTAEMPQMLTEHKAILQALDELGRAAKAECHPEVSRFVEELTTHAQNEEQVLYPAAILVGEYLKLKFPAVR
jgi:hemerythrin HHE cation binding domain-containing protein